MTTVGDDIAKAVVWAGLVGVVWAASFIVFLAGMLAARLSFTKFRLTASAVAAAILVAAFHAVSLEGVDGLALSLIARGRTEYAPTTPPSASGGCELA